MSAIEFGLMLQPFPLHFAGIDLYEYNRRLILIIVTWFHHAVG